MELMLEESEEVCESVKSSMFSSNDEVSLTESWKSCISISV